MESTNYAGMSIAALHCRPIDINGANKHAGDPETLLLSNWTVLRQDGSAGNVTGGRAIDRIS
jgi:hypothetical protein